MAIECQPLIQIKNLYPHLMFHLSHLTFSKFIIKSCWLFSLSEMCPFCPSDSVSLYLWSRLCRVDRTSAVAQSSPAAWAWIAQQSGFSGQAYPLWFIGNEFSPVIIHFAFGLHWPLQGIMECFLTAFSHWLNCTRWDLPELM